MFQVIDCGKVCGYDEFPGLKDKGWSKDGKFETFEEALIYARKWCASYGSSYDGLEGFTLTEENNQYDYSGDGDLIEIIKL